MKGGKAAGSSGIMPEMLKIGQTNGDFVLVLTELVRAAWREKRMLQNWQDNSCTNS